MASFLENFIEAGRGADFRKMDDLQQNTPYQIIKFSLKTTKFGQGLEGEIVDPNTQESFNLFFPERLAKKIKSDEDLQDLNDQHFSFIFKGRENRIAILEFFKAEPKSFDKNVSFEV